MTNIEKNADRRKLLVKYITPSILSMVSVFLYTIVDGIFVGRGVGTDALGAVNLAFPYVMIFMALVMMCTVGGMTITAIRIGRNDEEGANVSFMHSRTLTLSPGSFCVQSFFPFLPLLWEMTAFAAFKIACVER